MANALSIDIPVKSDDTSHIVGENTDKLISNEEKIWKGTLNQYKKFFAILTPMASDIAGITKHLVKYFKYQELINKRNLKKNDSKGLGVGLGQNVNIAGITSLPKHMEGFFNRSHKSAKRNEFIDKNDEKVAKSKWHTKSLGFFKTISLNSGSSLLMDIIKFFMFAAFFDPSGGLIMSIVNFLINIFTMVLGIIIKLIPTMIKLMLKTITNVGNALAKLVPTIFKMIIDGLRTLAGDFPWLTPLIDFFEWAGGFLVPVIQSLLKNAKLLFFIFVGFVLILKLIAIYQWLHNLAQKAAVIKTHALTAATWLLTSPIALVVIGVLLLIAAFVALYMYAEEISNFFDGIIDWFSQLGFWGKVLGGIIALILLPLTAFIGIIYTLVKLFKFIKTSGGVMKALNIAFESVMSFFKWFKYALANAFSKGSTLGTIISTITTVFKTIGNLGKDIAKSINFDSIRDGFTKLFDIVFDFIRKKMDFLGLSKTDHTERDSIINSAKKSKENSNIAVGRILELLASSKGDQNAIVFDDYKKGNVQTRDIVDKLLKLQGLKAGATYDEKTAALGKLKDDLQKSNEDSLKVLKEISKNLTNEGKADIFNTGAFKDNAELKLGF